MLVDRKHLFAKEIIDTFVETRASHYKAEILHYMKRVFDPEDPKPKLKNLERYKLFFHKLVLMGQEEGLSGAVIFLLENNAEFYSVCDLVDKDLIEQAAEYGLDLFSLVLAKKMKTIVD